MYFYGFFSKLHRRTRYPQASKTSKGSYGDETNRKATILKKSVFVTFSSDQGAEERGRVKDPKQLLSQGGQVKRWKWGPERAGAGSASGLCNTFNFNFFLLHDSK